MAMRYIKEILWYIEQALEVLKDLGKLLLGIFIVCFVIPGILIFLNSLGENIWLVAMAGVIIYSVIVIVWMEIKKRKNKHE